MSLMDRYSMFLSLEEVSEKRQQYVSANEEYKIIGSVKEKLVTPFTKHNIMFYEHGFSDMHTLTDYASYKLSEFIHDMYGYIEPDIYNRINFTCDYLLNFFEKDTENGETRLGYYPDAILYWEEYDEEIDGSDEKLFDAFVRNRDKLNMILPNHLVYDEENNCLKVSKLCPNLGLYMYKNLKDMFWYDKNMAQNYDRFLLSRFLKAESCYFTDSEYYVLERITNVNSVIAIANILKKCISFNNAKLLMTSSEDFRFRQEIDGLIKLVAKSPLAYSKSLILKKLFEEAKKEFDFQGELNLALRYVGLQFAKAICIFEQLVREESYQRLYKYLGDINVEILEDIKRVEELNLKDFNSGFLIKNPTYRDGYLIKDGEAASEFENVIKAHDTKGCLNVCIQKKFILYINYAERTNLFEGFVEA